MMMRLFGAAAVCAAFAFTGHAVLAQYAAPEDPAETPIEIPETSPVDPVAEAPAAQTLMVEETAAGPAMVELTAADPAANPAVEDVAAGTEPATSEDPVDPTAPIEPEPVVVLASDHDFICSIAVAIGATEETLDVTPVETRRRLFAGWSEGFAEPLCYRPNSVHESCTSTPREWICVGALELGANLVSIE
ncbi:MAG: hypothetical protein AAF192_02985 [Pseudomonadota bacterium]